MLLDGGRGYGGGPAGGARGAYRGEGRGEGGGEGLFELPDGPTKRSLHSCYPRTRTFLFLRTSVSGKGI